MKRKEIRDEVARIAEQDEWLTARELAPRIKKSASYVYSLIRRKSGIPFAELTPGTILFSWRSVNQWLHRLEAEKRRRNFED